MKAEKQLRKAAERLRKTVKAVNLYDDRVLEWTPVLLPADENHKHSTYWVDEHAISPSGGEGFRTVADCPWHLGDMNYIALMHPPVALLLANLLDNQADLVKIGVGMSGDMKETRYSPGSTHDYMFQLAAEINDQWKARARRPKAGEEKAA